MIARTFAKVLGRPVEVETVPHESWEPIFRAPGARNPLLRIRMLDGFNEGWIEFRDHGRFAVKGTTTLESVVTELVRASEAQAGLMQARPVERFRRKPAAFTPPARYHGGNMS